MDIKKIENFLNKKEDIEASSSSILSKWENEIRYLVDKKIKQKIIIEFLFENDAEIRNKYQDKYSNFQSMVSQFCSRLKKSKRRKTKDEDNLKSNSSQTTIREEPENKSTGILSKIENKKQDKKSFLPSDYVDGKDVLNKILKK